MQGDSVFLESPPCQKYNPELTDKVGGKLRITGKLNHPYFFFDESDDSFKHWAKSWSNLNDKDIKYTDTQNVKSMQMNHYSASFINICKR